MKPVDYNILDLIPQRPPMVMIDCLTDADERSAKGSLTIRETNFFYENGFLVESGLIEFIAQTAAAFTGFKSRVLNHNIAEGYIVSVKNLFIHELPPVNAEITSLISLENEIVGFTIILGKVFLGNRLIAECEMRILGKQG